MFFNRYFVPPFALLIVIALLHYFALENAYYWTIWWYDIMMHFLGGLWVALFVAWICVSGKIIFLPTKISFTKIVVAVIFVGVIWELYELFFNLTFTSDPEYASDTTLDLVMDTIGGAIGAIVSRKKDNA